MRTKKRSFGIAAAVPIALHGVIEKCNPVLDTVYCLSQSQSSLPVFAANIGEKRDFSSSSTGQNDHDRPVFWRYRYFEYCT